MTRCESAAERSTDWSNQRRSEDEPTLLSAVRLEATDDMPLPERHGWKSCGPIDTASDDDAAHTRPHTSLHSSCKPFGDAASDDSRTEPTLPRSLSAILADVSTPTEHDALASVARTPSPTPPPCYPEWQHLPDDLLKRTLSFLPNSYLRVVRLVCRQWEHAAARLLTTLSPESLALEPPLSVRCPSLVSLDLSNCLTEVHCFRAKELGLRSLLHDGHLASLLGLKRLTELKLRGCNGITAAGLARLAQLTTLQRLDLSRCGGVDEQGMQSLAALSRLQVLSLAGCVNVTDAGLATLVVLTQLRHLNLAGCSRVSNTGVQAIAQMQVLPSLRHVSVSWGSCVLGSGLQALAQLTSLQTLDISYVTPISVETQMAMPNVLPPAV